MRRLALAGLMALLSACAASPFETRQASVTLAEPSARAPRASREERLAAYWAERRKTASAPSAFAVSFDWRTQNFPKSVDSEDQADLDNLRLARESAAHREAVRAALR